MKFMDEWGGDYKTTDTVKEMETLWAEGLLRKDVRDSSPPIHDYYCFTSNCSHGVWYTAVKDGLCSCQFVAGLGIGGA